MQRLGLGAMKMPLLLFVPVLLSACAQTVDAPSLLPRAAEMTEVDMPAAPPPPPPVADPAQSSLIARLLDQAKAGDAAFAKALPAAATSAPPQSEAWIAAQNALSAVEIARAPALDALSALDAAIAEANDKGGDPAPLIAARSEVQAIYDRQSAKLDALSR
jgi:hypothetical protein